MNSDQQQENEIVDVEASEAVISRETACWFRTALGRYLLKLERMTVERAISRFFGYHQLELLLRADMAVGEKSLLGHRIMAVPGLMPTPAGPLAGQHASGEGLVVCQADELPFANESINLIILHHTLDITSQPHQTLREACRVLRSGGHIIIVGFNPLSSWGIRKLFNRKKKSPWSTRFLAPQRLEDWLNLLNFQMEHVSHNFFMPPLGRFSWLRYFGFLDKLGKRLHLPLGAFYTIQAQKRIAGSISLKPVWKRQSVTGTAVVHQFTPYRQNEKSKNLY
jgi:SAM-dependent methyltransferase